MFQNFNSLTDLRTLAILAFSAIVTGCNQSPAPAPGTPTTSAPAQSTPSTPSVDGTKYLLAKAPEASKDVIAAREAAKDGDEIIIEGRIGGDVNPWVDGRAAFTIVDRTLIPCNERPGDNCTSPWDYCCDTDRLPKSKAVVKFVDEQGKTLPTDARQLLGLKELQTVVIQGKAKRDDAGNLTVLASGLYVKPVAEIKESEKKSGTPEKVESTEDSK